MIEFNPRILPDDLKKYFRPKRKYGSWILRNELIWHKPNAMPSSVKDRFTVDFEKLYFFTKNKKYWFEKQYGPHQSSAKQINSQKTKGIKETTYATNKIYSGGVGYGEHGKNKRCVWKIPTKPFPEAHFAVYPPSLIETPIKAGCPEFICKQCKKAMIKMFDKKIIYKNYKHPAGKQFNTYSTNAPRWESEIKYTGYTNCKCNVGFTSGIVLDPFMGAGTTALVAKQLGRNYVGIELNPEYIEIANKRLAKG